MSPSAGSRPARPTLTQRRARLALAVAGVVLVAVLLVSALGGGQIASPPAAGTARVHALEQADSGAEQHG